MGESERSDNASRKERRESYRDPVASEVRGLGDVAGSAGARVCARVCIYAHTYVCTEREGEG